MRAGKSNKVRAAALALALAVNALFLALLFFTHAKTAREPVVAAMQWIVATMEQSLSPPRQSAAPRDRPRGEASKISVAAPAATPAEVAPAPGQQPLAPGPGPRIDWYAEIDKVIQDRSRSGEPDAQKSSPAVDPEVQVRPESFWIPPKAGTTEQHEGGVLRFWTSDLCYREYNPMESDPLTGRLRKGGRTVCKKRYMAERQSEARAEAVADAVRRKRSGSLPGPAAEQEETAR